MLGEQGPQLVEFNVRFGDPEAEVVLPLLDGDVTALLRSRSPRGDSRAAWTRDAPAPRCASCSRRAQGYPKAAAVSGGDPITGVERAGTVKWSVTVFPCRGTLRRARGAHCAPQVAPRVHRVTALGPSDLGRGTSSAPIAAVGEIDFAGMHFRRDIAAGALWSRRRVIGR